MDTKGGIEGGRRIPEAKEIYVLMQNEYRISRNIRAQWFLNNLNKVVEITSRSSKRQCAREIEVISAIPKRDVDDDYGDSFAGPEQEASQHVRIVADTKVIFLATRYRLVFCLDLSPSVAAVDSQHGCIFFDEVYPALKQSLEKVCQPFYVPGSSFYFEPQLHITVIGHVTNCPSGVPQVIVQGWILTAANVKALLTKLEENMQKVAERVARAVSKTNGTYDRIRVSSDSISGSIMTETSDSSRSTKIPHLLTADISALNLLRYGILALQLLPENSSAGIIVITDGVISFPSTQMQDSLLAQLRNSTISCSFLQIGSPYHPFSCFARCPYTELMQFIAAATCGAYFPYATSVDFSSEANKPNAYHEAFLFWSFQTTQTPEFLKHHDPTAISQSYWSVDNPYFYSVAIQTRVRKKHIEGTLKVSLENVLSCRLREGYTVKNVILDEAKNFIEVRLHLPWNLSTNFEYIVSSKSNQWQRSTDTELQVPSCHFELIVDGCYEFLHDVTCSDKKPIKSTYRTAVINQFWSYVRNLSHTDQILIQLHSFTHNPAHYTIPESIKNGVPLFYLPSNSTMPVLSSRSMAHSQFTTFWKPLCMLDINVWQKWMHTHRIGVILQHDMPLPKNLHLPNASGRYVHVQCRQAITALNSLLRDYSSFVLVENHFYIKFLHSEVAENPPTSFYVIRVTSKAPCMVIRLAFLGGLPGYERNEIVKDLRERICKLSLPRRATSEDHHSSRAANSFALTPQVATIDVRCCFLLKKPVEKVLIRYEKLPKNFMTSVADSQYSRSSYPQQLTEHVAANMLVTLSKYLHHQRWVWSMQRGPNCSLAFPIVSKILSVLTKIRLQEGFHFSHSNFGIIYMVMEIPMKVPLHKSDDEADTVFDKEPSACVVQYLLFPPHTNTTFKDSTSEEEDSELPEADGELQLITECWVEPQYGVTLSQSSLRNLRQITYQQISEALYAEDFECISVLTTFEHLKMMCKREGTSQEQSLTITLNEDVVPLHPGSPKRDFSLSSLPTASLGSNISLVPYTVELTRLLPKCHQTELIFPTLLPCVVIGEVQEGNIEAVPLEDTNDLLFEFFIGNMKSFQDREVGLSLQDCLSFMLHVHHRPRDAGKEPQSPFHHPELYFGKDAKWLTDLHLENVPNCSYCVKALENQPEMRLDPETYQRKLDGIPKWRCFLRGSSSHRFLMTFVPSTYSDLKKLFSYGADTSADAPEDQQHPEKINLQSDGNASDKPVGAGPLDEIQDQHVDVNKGPKYSVPVYVYDCVLSSVIKQLVNDTKSVGDDNFDYYTFSYESSSLVESCEPEHSDLMFGEEKKQRKRSDKALMKMYRIQLDKAFSKAYVCAVYRSLVLGLPVDAYDATSAVDEICEESLLEIDITDFVYTICGHVKDFVAKNCLRRYHETKEKDAAEEGEDQPRQLGHESCDGKNACLDFDGCRLNFPLCVLQKHQPCEQLQQKHNDIKKRFSEILGNFLKKIPSRPDYYVFSPDEQIDEVDDDGSGGRLLAAEAESVQEAGDDVPTDGAVSLDEQFEKDTSSNAGNPDGASLNSHGNTESPLSSLRDDSDLASQKGGVCPPLFVHLLCSVKTKQGMKSCSVHSLPTCLNDIIECIESDTAEVSLQDLHITLDITCLTLPNDIRNPCMTHDRQYSASFSSSSPIPDQNQYRGTTVDDDDDNDSLSDSPSETVQPTALQNIPSFQRDEIYRCIDKIKWLLLDEKASAALYSYPITSATLEMVTTHVRSTEESPCCMVKEVTLNFVYGPDSSVSKFLQVFKNMSLPGYRLDKVDRFWFIVLDNETAPEKQHCQLSSLNPPLGVASKHLLIQQKLHCDDSMKLKAASEEVREPYPLSSKESVMSSKTHEFSEDEDDARSSEQPFPQSRQRETNTHPKAYRKTSKCFDREDSEDEAECQKVSSQNHKKGKDKNVPSGKNSALSVTSTQRVTLPRNACSLPANLHILCSGEVNMCVDSKPHLVRSEEVPVKSAWKTDKLDSGKLAYPEWSSEVASMSRTWEFPLASKTTRSVSSMPSTTKCGVQESLDSSRICSDADFASIFGSGHLSNAEDGYDGDSSDTCSEWDWLSALDTKRPLLPNFWLIMTVDTSKVTVYFHIRHRNEEDEELKQSKLVLSQVVTVITSICKEVNQMMLLQTLHETRMCNRLLVPEESDDIFPKSDLDMVAGSSEQHRTYSDEAAPLAQVHEKYLEANLRFMSGAFSCDVVWVTHFRLHHRLTSGSTGGFVSKGIQALQAVLNSFSVNNRKNMFVYQETSGSVFYLRLHEVVCDEHHNFNKPKAEGSLSPTGSCSSSAQNMAQRKGCADNTCEGEFRPRVNSGHSDIDRQDSSSTISGSRSTRRCIALDVHGIGEVDIHPLSVVTIKNQPLYFSYHWTEIKVDLIQVLQNRLNEGVLDMIIMMLSRNPHCKLTPEDVQFIQNPEKQPSSEIHFTVPVKLLCYAHSIHMYLRQNMLHFLHNPKYTDSRKENHFKAYSRNPAEWSQVEDNDIFLYHSYQASGYSGSKGIACIILSLVTGQGHPFKHFNNSLPNPTAYQDGVSENDFDELTSTTCHQFKKSKTPGPVALVRFQIWSVGKDIVSHIESRLLDAVRHSLWDLLMEYKVMTAPVTDADVQEDLSCFSEPATPIRVRRTGKVSADVNTKGKEFISPLNLQGSKDISSSVPDIAAKAQSPRGSLHNAPVFQFNSGPQSARAELCGNGQTSLSASRGASADLRESEKRNLNFIFHSPMKAFLQFGSKLGCPALSRHVFELPSRHSVSVILTEIEYIVKNTVRDLRLGIFMRRTSSINADTEFVPYNPSADIEADEANDGNVYDDGPRPGTRKSFIVVARNNKQWKSYMGMSDFSRFHEAHSDILKNYQRYETHICNNAASERYHESTPTSPVEISRSNSMATLSSPRLKSSEQDASAEAAQDKPPVLFVPRQRLLLIFIEDRNMTVFLYNWSHDVTNSFMKQLSKLIQWHDCRDSLLNNIVTQKLGLYHGQVFLHPSEKTEKSEKTESSHRGAHPNATLDWAMAEQLFMYHSPPREPPSSATSSKLSRSSSAAAPVAEILKNRFPPVPFHVSQCSTVKDPVKRNGWQVQDVRNAHRRDLQELHAMWQARGTSFHCPYVERLLLLLKRAARLSHYCLTPILFSPSWRWKVAPIRDHTLQPLECHPVGLERSPSDASSHGRSRHSSGSSLKNSEGASVATTSTSRSRRTSGVSVQNTSQTSPKLRVKNPSEETWHQTVCSHYLLEYIQYLHTLGFVSLQTKESPQNQGSSKVLGSNGESKCVKIGGVSLPRTTQSGSPFYLIRYLLGGLLLFEVGLFDPYAYGHLYTIECSRLHACSTRALSSQFTAAFLDEVDKIKALMHLHSFTYDYHLRTIHSYISGRQLIFRNGYHLTSFLDDFIKYYQKSPNCARNLLHAGKITVPDINMSGDQLYNYIISHNHMYGMKVLRMVPIVQDDSLMMNTEFVLVELSSGKASYKDANDVCQMGSFDIGLLINHNTEDCVANQNSLVVNYYIILTSQRELYPKLANLDTRFGSFQTVRFASSQVTSSAYSSRKTSAVSMVTEKEKFESSGEESSSSDTRSRKVTASLGITDEEVTYLGYFSNQETMMKQVLKKEAETACAHLNSVFSRAATHCRRDFLWSSLLPRSSREEESHGRDSHVAGISDTEFTELLNFVTPVPLDDIDPNLKPFLSMPISWYQSLAVALKSKYGDLRREFWDLDQNTQHVVVTHPRCPDSFMLLSIECASNKAELCMVFRELPSSAEHTADKPSQKVLALQSLVEEFVNVCCFHLWCSIVG